MANQPNENPKPQQQPNPGQQPQPEQQPASTPKKPDRDDEQV